MYKIAENSVVSVSYYVTDETDQVVGRTDTNQPMVALLGKGQLVKGLEDALIGLSKGDEFVTTLEPKDAFGEIKQELIQEIDRGLFGNYPLEKGNMFEADTSTGPRLVIVSEIKENTVVVDGNHPLAGKTLKFMGTVEDAREATAEEIAHGHAHPDGLCPSESHGGCCGGHGGHGCGCGGGHHHHHEEDHECYGGGHEHGHGGCGCSGHGHHHDDEEHECCGGHGHGHGHHHGDEEHECCGGGHGHGHGGCGCRHN